MFRWQRHHLILAVYGLLVSIGAFAAALAISLIPPDPRNAVFLGFSIQRLALIGSMLLAGISAALFAAKSNRDQVFAERVWNFFLGQKNSAGMIRWGTVIVFISGWVVSFTPAYRFLEFKEYVARLSPIINWLTFVSALTFTVAWIEEYGFDWEHLRDVLRAQKKTLTFALIPLTVFALTWVMISASGLGLKVSEDYWYGAGVPVLLIQVLLAFALGLGMFVLERSSIKLPSRTDILIFFLIWAVTAFLWAREPLRDSYFSPGPLKPNLEYYPYSDGATFDSASQFALIGQGINNGLFFDRALYMGFLVFLHTFAGQNYVQVVALQAAIYAVLPGILYLLGKNIHSRTFGVVLAALTALRGLNSIAGSSMIDLASPKQMLTDFPTAIFAAWFVLMAVKWLKAPEKNYTHAVWMGGIAGLALLLRTHALFLALFGALLAVLVYWRQKTRGLIIAAIIAAAMFASILPWGIRSDGSVFDIYMRRIRTVIQERYYTSPAPTAVAPAANSTPVANIPTAAAPQATAMPLAENPAPVNAIPDKIHPVSLPASMATHFLHNMATSFFILPTSPDFHDLPTLLKEAVPFWKQYWDGGLNTVNTVFFIFNLSVIALGIGIAWKFARYAGLIPFFTFLVYNLGNAMARTSGGRYVAPTDWVIILYFALGLLQLILWGLAGFKLEADFDNLRSAAADNAPRSTSTWEPLIKITGILLTFVLIGSLLPLSETLFPRRYPLQTQAELYTVLDEQGLLREIGLDKAALQTASQQWPSLQVINGRALYPRFYQENKGESKRQYPFLRLPYPRMAFIVIGPQGMNQVILPKEEASYFPNASDVFVLGCQQGTDIDALAVIVVQGDNVVYVRQPSTPLQCPLPQPVCDQNHVCR